MDELHHAARLPLRRPSQPPPPTPHKPHPSENPPASPTPHPPPQLLFSDHEGAEVFRFPWYDRFKAALEPLLLQVGSRARLLCDSRGPAE